MKYVTIFLELPPGSCPRGCGLRVTGVETDFFFNKNLILGHSWWNVFFAIFQLCFRWEVLGIDDGASLTSL